MYISSTIEDIGCSKEKKYNMNWQTYYEMFNSILEAPSGTYLDPEYLHYTQMNLTRTNRWLKNYNPLPETIQALEEISALQHWELITEQWCGDAAHSTPVIYKLSTLNPLIKLNIQLRDQDSEIDSYLTSGSKSIPILIVRDEEGNDLYTWGPRPVAAQEDFLKMKASESEMTIVKEALQKWYNHDKGRSTESEIAALVRAHNEVLI